MNKVFYRLGWTVGLALMAGPLWAHRSQTAAANQCHPDQTLEIASEHRCVQSGGIDIGDYGETGMEVACLKDKRVQGACGPDGSITRQYAFADWLTKLKQFQDSCDSQGGTFSYADPNFTEPQDPSYCLPAEPQIGSNMFEEPLCNFRSVCPPVSVRCDFPCHSGPPVASDTDVSQGSIMALAPIVHP